MTPLPLLPLRPVLRRLLLPLLASVLLPVLAGCGGSGTTTVGISPTSASPPPTSAGPAVLVLDENANHTTVRAAAGTLVRVTLHSTYWSTPVSSAPQVLVPVPTLDPKAPSPSPLICRPGMGCGIHESLFHALRAGSAQLTATRTSCGEAMECAPDQRTFTVTIEVSA
ncbi:hypothetical protein GCM10009665_50900 [Kitasatospora nipponensis]|uniref:Lipoprotein n=1 Tax=Kitasatospora nipponensis TaxID=258049 RepID=A0ABN1WNU1_9ACTN